MEIESKKVVVIDVYHDSVAEAHAGAKFHVEVGICRKMCGIHTQ
jgi:hypothetical protein